MNTTFRIRLVACSVLLVGLAFVQAPGLLVSDTKFDLAADPVGFLSRALHLWDPTAIFGQLQNQAYGYLWPMGPFFAAGDLLGVPAWAVQRGWLALVLVVAFGGAALLARELGLRSDLACLVAGLAYATSPRMLSTLGPISIEAWPSAVAPWVLLPLVVGARRGSPVRAAGLSALAVGTVGGVNAAATAAVLPLGALWLLTRTPGPRRRSMVIWWPVLTFLATAWWLVPLFLLGAYSPPFLDWIESAGITTFSATPFDVLRGTSAWVGYVDPGWGAGAVLVRLGYLVMNSGIVLALGLVGLAAVRLPHRRFLVLGLLTGLLLTSAGHVGATVGWGAGTVSDLLDGVLAPLRNVHKFDPVVRLPLVLGLAGLVEELSRRARPGSSEQGVPRVVRGPVTALVVLGVVGAALPVALGQLPPSGPVLGTPPYWQAATRWLDAEVPTTTLYAPGTGFGDYLWGSPRDEPFQYLGERRWAVRNAVPLTPAGTIRYLGSLEDRLADGEGSLALTRALRRAGIGAVVLRHDVRAGQDVPDPVLVRQALIDSPGVRLVRSFGPEVGGEPVLTTDQGRLVVNGGWQTSVRALEVFEVDGGAAPAVAAPGDPTVLVGGPEDVVDALDADLLGAGPTVLAAATDTGREPAGRVLLSDGMVDRERTFGRIHEATSAVRVPGSVRRTQNRVADYDVPGVDGWRTRGRLIGARSLSASASGSDATAFGGAVPAQSPYAAVDDDPATAWQGAAGGDGRVWWRVGLTRPLDSSRVRLEAPLDGPSTSFVRVSSDAGTSQVVPLRAGSSVEVGLPGRPRRWLRVEEQQPRTGQLALTEVSAPGLTVARSLALPAVPDAWPLPAGILLRRLDGSRGGCAVVEGRVPCRESQARAPEERRTVDRVVRLPRLGAYDATLTARGLPGSELEQLVQAGQLVTVEASSTGPLDLRASGLAAVDGRATTTWTPRLDDAAPSLTLRWLRPQLVRGVTLGLDREAPARAVRRVALVWPDGRREVPVGKDGTVAFAGQPPIRTDELRIIVLDSTDTLSIDAGGVAEPLPPGVSEVSLDGAPLPPAPSPVDRVFACGTGPDVVVGGAVARTRVVGAPADLVAGRSVRAEPCDGTALAVALAPGATRVLLRGDDAVTADRLVLRRGSASPAPAGSVQARGVASPPATRVVRPPSEAGTVVLRQNVNPGWVGTQGGRRVRSFASDGWQQGWRTGGDGVVRATFEPDSTYRAGLVLGGVLALLLVLGLVVPGGRWPRPLRRGRDAWDSCREREPGRAARAAGAGGALLVGGLLGGWPGFLGGVVAAAAVVALGRRGEWPARLLAPSTVGLAALAYVVRPWGSSEGWAGNWAWAGQLVVVGVVALGVLVLRDRRTVASSTGRSTNR